MVPLTRAENIRRWVLIALCILASIPGGFIINNASKRIDEIRKHPNEPGGNIKQIEERISQKKKSNESLQLNILEYCDPIGFRNDSRSAIDRFEETYLDIKRLKLFLDRLTVRLEKIGVEGNFDKWFKDEIGSLPNMGNNRLLIRNIFEKINARYEFYTQQLNQFKQEITKINADEKEIFERLRQHDEKFKKDVEAEVKKFIAQLNEITTMNDRNEKEIEALNNQVDSKTQTRDDNRKKYKEDLAKLSSQLKEVADHLKILQARKKESEKVEKDADGYIISADLDKNIVYLNLTKKDKLFNNLRFKVFTFKDKIMIEKGEVEVFEIGNESSKAFILAMDPKNPIKELDHIYNERYDKNKQAKIVICGTCSKYREEMLQGLVRQGGDLIENKVDENTTFVILGNGYEKDPNYLLAVKYGVRTYAERYLYEFLGIPAD